MGQLSETAGFGSQRRVHLEHVRDPERRGCLDAGGAEQRVALVDRLGAEQPSDIEDRLSQCGQLSPEVDPRGTRNDTGERQEIDRSIKRVAGGLSPGRGDRHLGA